MRPEMAGNLMTHDLRELATRLAAFPCSFDELELLDKLHKYTLWAGRYPMPRQEGRLQLGGIPERTGGAHGISM